MKLLSKTNYAIVSTSEFVSNTIVNYIKINNEKDGVYLVPSFVGNHIVVSDTANPNSKKYVISKIERPADVFTNLNIDEVWNKLFSEMFGLPYVNTLAITLKDYQLEQVYTLFLQASSHNFDTPIHFKNYIKDLSEKKYSLKFSYYEKLDVIMNWINNPTHEHYSKFLKTFLSDDFPFIVSIMTKIVNSELSDFYKEKYSDITSSSPFLGNMLRMAIIIINAENYEEAMLSFSKLINN